MKSKRIFMSVIGVMTLASVVAPAQSLRSSAVKENRALVYHGKLVRPDGQVPQGAIPVTIKILSPDPKLCVLWKETQTVTLNNGAFSMEIGHAVNRVGGAVADFKLAFVNNPSATPLAATCADGSTSYVPGASDDRLLSASFNDGGEVVEVSGMPIKSVPFALQAEELAGFGIANLVKISGVGSSVTFTPLQVDELKAISDTALDFDMKTRKVKNVGAPVDPGDATTKSYVDTAVAAASGGGALPQANATTNGYLSSADWTTFNNKQPAGAYLTSITSGNVNTALGFTPVSNVLPAGQVFVGNGSNVAAGTFFGIGQMRNNMGALQMPTACAASQTLTWNAVNDVLACTNINGLDADKVTTGAFATARLGSGTADATKYLRGDGSWQTLPSGADNLGNHTATQNLNLANYQLVGNGGASGLSIAAGGNVGVGTASPAYAFDLQTGTSPTLRIRSDAGSNNATIRLIEDTADTDLYGFSFENNGNDNKLYLKRHENSQAGAAAMTIDRASGSIGIGTTSPNATLQVAGPGHVTYGHVLVGGSSSEAGKIVFLNPSGSPQGQIGYATGTSNEFRLISNGGGGYFTLHTGGGERLRVENGGNVGIGTTTPSEKLEVGAGGKIKSPEYCIGASCITAWPSGGGGGVASVGVGGPPLSVVNGTSTPTISIAQANTTTAGYLSSADWNTFNGKVGTGYSLAGDVSGTPAATVVDRIKGKSVTAAPTLAGQVLRYDGTNFVPNFIGMLDLRSNVTGTTALAASCAASQTLTYNSVGDNLTCSSIAIANTQVSGLGALATKATVDLSTSEASGILPVGNGGTGTATGSITAAAGNGLTFTAGSGGNYNVRLTPSGTGHTILDGNVGIGTASPALKLSVAGEVQVGSTSAACSAANAGALQYSVGTMQLCNGTSWLAVAGAWNVSPAGAISAFPMATCPAGWLEADGAAVSRATYASLFTALSTNYGAGDGSSTFNLPDYRGYFLRGWDHGAGIDPDSATRTNRGDGTTGNNVGTKQDDQLKSHTHTIRYTRSPSNAGTSSGIPYDNTYSSNTANYTSGISADTAGGNQTNPKNINVIYCVSTALAPTLTTASSGSGTANYVPLWSGTTTLSNSPIFVGSGNVGIGTTSPAAKLEVAGSIRGQGVTAGAACTGLGSQAYDSTSGAPLYCSGSSVWTAVGGGGGVQRDQIFFLSTTMIPGATTYYLPLVGTGVSTTENLAQVAFARAGTLKRCVSTTRGQPGSGSFVATVRKNGADTAMVFTIPLGAASGSQIWDTTTTVAFAAGDLIALKMLNNAGTASSLGTITCEYEY